MHYIGFIERYSKLSYIILLTISSRDGIVARVFASYQCGLGLIVAHCNMWVESFIGPRSPCSEALSSGSLVFQFDHNRSPAKTDAA